jgi:hypothetical protein
LANTETRHREKTQCASSGLTTNAPYKPATAKAGGRYIDNIFVERLWRSLKYEEVVCCERVVLA